MRARHVLWAAVAVAGLYAALLLWADSRDPVMPRLPQLAAALPLAMALTLASWGARYWRWRWLLRGRPLPWLRGWLAYLSGFAFTTTPGKVGELVRIRYFRPLGVPAEKALAAFVFERACDLVVVFLLSALAVPDPRLLALLALFVAVLLGLVAALAARPRPLRLLGVGLRRRGWRGAASVARTLRGGLVGCRLWLNPADLTVSLALGVLAWALAALAFAWLLLQLGVQLPWNITASIYPTAMLAGAASFLPGGIGTAETAIVALLAAYGVAASTGALAAVGIRVASLWFAVAAGLGAIAVLERAAPPAA